MSAPAIKVEGLWKEYQLGGAEARHRTFREMLSGLATAPVRRLRHLSGASASAERFWSLRDVSLEIEPGEVVGVIGRNGAGKSTLLKILSRISPPTRGRVEIRGRVSSLLEVGTGFHPELTGRENVFLNGAILGMSRREIRRKFDEIVEFAGVERFLDTPVKRYSSGMRVRLAFSVAAHLEPEVLLIDEVLAVGDAEFQRRCLGKMRDVAAHGRTVVFVSHNLGAVRNLCGRGLLIADGEAEAFGSAHDAVAAYLGRMARGGGRIVWDEGGAPGTSEFRLLSLEVRSAEGGEGELLGTDDAIECAMDFDLRHSPRAGLCVGFDLTSSDGSTVFRTYHTDQPQGSWPVVRQGQNRFICAIPAGLLNGGVYYVSPLAGIHNQEWFLNPGPMVSFELERRHGSSPLGQLSQGNVGPGLIAPLLEWRSGG